MEAIITIAFSIVTTAVVIGVVVLTIDIYRVESKNDNPPL